VTTQAELAASGATLHPLFDALFARHGFTQVDAAGFPAFAAREGHVLLAFLEDPPRVKESLDLAVILPEIDRAFPGRLTVGVLLPETARAIEPRFGFGRWPALVVLHAGRYVGAIAGLRSWDDYVTEVARLLDAAPTRAPAIGIAVRPERAAP
jgi:hydrogenase-1 operon protein HyaE